MGRHKGEEWHLMVDLLFVRLPRLIAGLFLLAAICINFANVVGRYLFSAPIFWAEEAMIFLIIWSVFLAFVSITATGEHLKMDILSTSLPRPLNSALDRIGLALGVVAMLFISWQSSQAIGRLWRFDMRSIALEIPMVIPHAAVITGFALSAIGALIPLIRGRQ
jgi:TRAP-type C4-dicarboxylate transport system permease small subunit